MYVWNVQLCAENVRLYAGDVRLCLRNARLYGKECVHTVMMTECATISGNTV